MNFANSPHICRYPPCMEANSFISNLKIYHAVVTKDPLKMETLIYYLKICHDDLILHHCYNVSHYHFHTSDALQLIQLHQKTYSMHVYGKDCKIQTISTNLAANVSITVFPNKISLVQKPLNE